MSKAEELAKKITQYHRFGYETEDQAKLRRIEQHKEAAAHLRALEANRQMLVEALELCVEFINEAQILEAQWHWEPVKQARTALEQAKELT